MSAPPLVSTDWLAERLGAPRLRIVDATWFMPGQGDAHAAYLRAHVPGAVFFDIDEVADKASGLPHMLPAPEAFAEAVSRLGIADDDHVVTYGVAGPRVWWSFRAMGHDDVSVLDGGLGKWTAEGRPIESGELPPHPARFTARYRPELVADFDRVAAALQAGGPVVDARPGERFRGEAPEPRPGLKSGHMPGAKSLPSGQLFNADGTFRPEAETVAALAEQGLLGGQAPIATCGSGVTAAMLALALARAGRWDAAVYDGSWTEWGGRDGAPVATGPA
jgi:thiosulfate/3-mercaptopyruvate sulfurtransferase